MLGAAGSTLATLIHAVLCLAAAPLLAGLVAWVRAAALGRRGPGLSQPFQHLRRLLAKEALVPETAGACYPVWPFVVFAATLIALLLVPGFCGGLLTAPLSDLITILGLRALARAAGWLASMETGAAADGAAVARGVLTSVFAEGAALVVLLTLALMTGTTRVDGIALALRAGAPAAPVSLGFALVAMLAVALNENGHADDKTAAYSGRYLALLDYAAMLRLLLWIDLIGALFLPFGMAQGDQPLSWPLGLAMWVAKLVVIAALLAAFEVSRARMNVFRVPALLGFAVLLGGLAGLFLFVSGPG